MRYRVGKSRLRECLRNANMSQSELSARTGIHRSNISEYAKNKREMTLSTAKTIASALDCHIDDLYNWDNIHVKRRH